MTAVTENIVRQLRDRGMEVVDFRGVLPVNSRYPYRQLQGGVSGVKYIIIHWTGDAFSREFFRNVVGHDYGTSIISPDMSQPEEEMLVKWYNNYHMGKDGGTWPGIAYGIMVFPSGRIFVNFDVGTLSYHAFNANSVSYAVCMPNSNGQQPTTAQTLAINNVLDILAYHTPDIPAGHRQFFGHREATFLDSRNQTSCPGVWLPLVQHWRDTGTPTVELGKQPPGSSPTSVLHFPETGKNLVWGFKGRWEFLEQKLGREAMIWSYGYPLTDEIPDVDIDGQKRTVQVFERSVWVWHPENEGKFWEVTLVQDGKEWATQRGLL